MSYRAPITAGLFPAIAVRLSSSQVSVVVFTVSDIDMASQTFCAEVQIDLRVRPNVGVRTLGGAPLWQDQSESHASFRSLPLAGPVVTQPPSMFIRSSSLESDGGVPPSNLSRANSSNSEGAAALRSRAPSRGGRPRPMPSSGSSRDQDDDRKGTQQAANEDEESEPKPQRMYSMQVGITGT